jgi:hypothetical protein
MPTYTFTSTGGPIAITDNNALTASSIHVSGVVGQVATVKITLNGLTHAFPADLDFMLSSPSSVTDYVFMSDAGTGFGPSGATNLNLTFSDDVAPRLPGDVFSSGEYRPADYGQPAEQAADFGVISTITFHAAPASDWTFGAAFNGVKPNDDWTLHVGDDTAGNVGSLDSWSIEITTVETYLAIGQGSGGFLTTPMIDMDGIVTPSGFSTRNSFDPFPGVTTGLSLAELSNGKLVVGTTENGARVSFFDTTTGTRLGTFLPFGPVFSGGVDVAWFNASHLAVGSGVGMAPQVNIYDATDPNAPQLLNQLAPVFSDPAYAGGVDVAWIDATHVAVAQLGGGQVQIFDISGASPMKTADVEPFGGGYTGGLHLAAAPDGDVAVGQMSGASQVAVLDSTGQVQTTFGQQVIFTPFAAGYTGGVDVAWSDASTLSVSKLSGSEVKTLRGAFVQNDALAFDPAFTGGAHVANISDLPTVSIDNVTHAEGNGGLTPFTFTATLDHTSVNGVLAEIAVRHFSDGASASDVAFQDIVVVFDPGETSKSFTIWVNGDAILENDEYFGVAIFSVTNATAGADATGIITDDEPGPVVQETAQSTSEDTPLNGTIAATPGIPSDPLTFALVGSNGGAQHGVVTLDAATGAYTYLPFSNTSGEDSFQVVANELGKSSAPGTVHVTVDPANDVPRILIQVFAPSGTPDVVVSNVTSGTIGALLGDGAGALAPANVMPSGDALVGNPALADLDGDGDTDIAVPLMTANKVAVFLNNGDGSFVPGATTADLGASPTFVAAGDIDADGDIDLIVSNTYNNSLTALRGNGAGQFEPFASFGSGGAAPGALALGDVNGDGALDIVVGNTNSAAAMVLLGNSLGWFGSPTAFSGGTAGVKLADLNGDGALDVVSGAGNSVNVLIGHGNGTFAPVVLYGSGSITSDVAVGDIDRDGDLDIVAPSLLDGTVAALLNDGNGTFAPGITTFVGGNLQGLALADMNADDTLDVIVGQVTSSTVAVSLGNGDGTFQSATTFATGGTQSSAIAVGQLDGHDVLPATSEIVPLVFSTATGNAIKVTDPDDGNVTVTLSAAHGALTLTTTTGLSFSTGDGNADATLTFTGSVTAINTALDGLSYAAMHFHGDETLIVAVNDNGNGGGGALTANTSITIAVSDALDVFSGTPGDDAFMAPSGQSRVDAGLGVDTATFDFKLTDATVTYSSSTVIIDGPSSHTVLCGIEKYVFTDGTVDNNDGNWLVDDLFYYSQNHDVWNPLVDADSHYASHGWHEARDPNAFYSTSTYLSANPDVRAAGVDPLDHWHSFGWHEGRVPSIDFDPRQYLLDNPDVAAANRDPLLHFLAIGASEGRQPVAPTELAAANGFDFVYYLANNPDVAAAGVDPLQHFQTVGWVEGRNPNALFDTAGYLATYGDVKAAGINPLDHYHQYGWKEGRDPSPGFDTTDYLAANPDVNAAGIDPLAHYLDYGRHEGRSAFADGVWG